MTILKNLQIIPQIPSIAPDDTSVPEATMLIAGDACPMRHYEEKIIRAEEVLSPALVDAFQQHDFSLLNLESPLCDPALPTMSHLGHGLRCAPAVAHFLRRIGITAVSLANNHILDYQAAGMYQTIQALKEAGLIYTGAGRNRREAERVLEVTLRGLRCGIWALAEQELNCEGPESPGSSCFNPQQQLEQVAELREKYDFLLLYIHAGHEFTDTPSPRLRDAYRSLLRAGADLLVAHHPHVVQGIEKHGDGWIAYSLGNLIFDSDYVTRFEDARDSIMLSVTIRRHEIVRLDVIPCRMRRDYFVSDLSREEALVARARQEQLNAYLQDHAFPAEWERNVRKRWQEEYYGIIKNFSDNFFALDNKDFAIRYKNLFRCPTHLEMFQELCRLWEEGKMPRPRIQS